MSQPSIKKIKCRFLKWLQVARKIPGLNYKYVHIQETTRLGWYCDTSGAQILTNMIHIIYLLNNLTLNCNATHTGLKEVKFKSTSPRFSLWYVFKAWYINIYKKIQGKIISDYTVSTVLQQPLGIWNKRT